MLKAFDLVLDQTSMARGLSSAINTQGQGIVYRLPVVWHAWHVYWTAAGPRIEAVLKSSVPD